MECLMPQSLRSQKKQNSIMAPIAIDSRIVGPIIGPIIPAT